MNGLAEETLAEETDGLSVHEMDQTGSMAISQATFCYISGKALNLEVDFLFGFR